MIKGVSMIKHIFSDMDGTLLNNQGQISKGNVQAIQASQIPFSLVSARSPLGMAFAVDRLALSDYQIAFNGAVIFKKQGEKIKVFHEQKLDFELVSQLVKQIQTHFPDVSVSLYGLETWYVDQVDERIEMEYSFTKQPMTIVDYQTFFNQQPVAIYKIMMITKTAQQVAEVDQLLASFKNQVNVTQSGHNYMEITHQLAQKSTGAKIIAEKSNLTYQELAAFGDGHNDLSILNYVGCPIVMANAATEIKTVAKHITKSNQEDGVGYAINHIINHH